MKVEETKIDLFLIPGGPDAVLVMTSLIAIGTSNILQSDPLPLIFVDIFIFMFICFIGI